MKRSACAAAPIVLKAHATLYQTARRIGLRAGGGAGVTLPALCHVAPQKVALRAQ